MSTSGVLDGLGWDSSWQELAAASTGTVDPGTVRPGRVGRVDRGLCVVHTAEGTVRASLAAGVLADMAADAARGPCTGDWCLLRDWPDGPTVVDVLLPRRSVVSRAQVRGTSSVQILAANVDIVAVVVGLHPEPNLGRIERLLALAWESGSTPLVVLTKADLVSDAALVAADVRAAAPGVDVIVCSTVSGTGIADVRRCVGTVRTAALIGASGHGKSSLTNALQQAQAVVTATIRADGKGRHTSVRRELVPLSGGGCVIDTPGRRAVGLREGDAGVDDVFPEIIALAGACRFSDCGHRNEPGCAVSAAVESGELSWRRVESWFKLQREAAWFAARTDARLRAERTKEWKRLSQFQRSTKRSRG